MKQKNNNAITINVADDVKSEIEIIAAAYQRKPAELLRLLLIPCITKEYAKLMKLQYSENQEAPTVATFHL
ncbi:MAG: hypothetical protein J6S85_16845 [Methanobrevibacter sp.]|nr:hypothetical protein [Methanobrevibacter sp.]